MPYRKLTDEQRQRVIDRKRHHDRLLAAGEYKKARRCGIKVIAYEAGIHPSMIYKYMKNA